jgi:hypothetical protein
MLKIGWKGCPYCGDHEVYRSRSEPMTWLDRTCWLFLLQLVRCYESESPTRSAGTDLTIPIPRMHRAMKKGSARPSRRTAFSVSQSDPDAGGRSHGRGIHCGLPIRNRSQKRREVRPQLRLAPHKPRNIRLASFGWMPAIFQKYHPAGGPASFPIIIRQSAGGFCSPRSHREITIDEQLRCFPKSS